MNGPQFRWYPLRVDYSAFERLGWTIACGTGPGDSGVMELRNVPSTKWAARVSSRPVRGRDGRVMD